MRSGELSLAIEIPPGFGRDVERGKASADCRLGGRRHAQRAQTVLGYVQGMHSSGWSMQCAAAPAWPPRPCWRWKPATATTPMCAAARHGARGHPAAAAHAARHAHCAWRWCARRKWVPLHQPLRHAHHAHRVHAGQAVAVCGAGHAQLWAHGAGGRSRCLARPSRAALPR